MIGLNESYSFFDFHGFPQMGLFYLLLMKGVVVLVAAVCNVVNPEGFPSMCGSHRLSICVISTAGLHGGARGGR